ncbi:MAG: DUF2802 domain-containing protein [Pseudomonadota bacterium]
MIIDSYYAEMLMIANGMLLCIACYAIVRFERRCKEIEAFWASPTGNAVAAAGSDKSGEQVQITERLEKRVGELQRSVKLMELNRGEEPAPEVPPKSIERSLPIENAQRMAKLGASIEDLTRNCGLNIGEARLMQKLHGKSHRATAVH